MVRLSALSLCLATLFGCSTAQVELPISATALEYESDWTSIYYSKSQPLLIGNDGSAAAGGFHTFSLNGNSSSLTEVASVAPGRTKLMTVVYNVGREDLIISIDQPTSVLRAYN